jgi:hypothetical protein
VVKKKVVVRQKKAVKKSDWNKHLEHHWLNHSSDLHNIFTYVTNAYVLEQNVKYPVIDNDIKNVNDYVYTKVYKDNKNNIDMNLKKHIAFVNKFINKHLNNNTINLDNPPSWLYDKNWFL